ncbi:hypothetical protein ACOMHN_030106 [Nucella lapillus]
MGYRDPDDRSASDEPRSVGPHTVTSAQSLERVAEDSPQLRMMTTRLRQSDRDVSVVDDVTEGKPLVGGEEESSLRGLREEMRSQGDDEDKKKEDEADDEGKDEEETESLLYDRGWAWLICLGCFIAHFLIGGLERSDGVMFLEFTDKFQQSAQLTAWPAALCSASRLVMGPFATALSNRFSVRTSVMAGAFLFATALIVSGFAPNVAFLIFCYGLLQGIGRGLAYAPSVIVVGLYFKRRQGFSIGLGSAGVGAGTLVIPPVTEWMFQQLGFQGAFLVLGALVLNTCVVAALFRPFFVHRNIVLGYRYLKTDEEQALFSPGKTHDTIPLQKPATAEVINDSLPNPESEISKAESESLHLRHQASTVNTSDAHKTTLRRKKPKQSNVLKSVFKTCFPTEERRKDSPKRKLIEWSLLKNPAFLFYCFSICLFTVAFKSAFTFLPALAASRGVSPTEGAYLLSISGVLDTIGRISSGFILETDCLRPFRPIVYNSVVFVIMGLSVLSPFMRNFVEFAVLFGFYGMLTGTYVSQKSVILVDILGQEKLSSSFGLLICFQGLGTFIGPPLSGLLKDVFGRFDEAFFVGGAAMALSGLLMIVSNLYRIRHSRNQLGTEIPIKTSQ